MRNPLHSICPYFAMFPEQFVAQQVQAFTRRGDLVFDPFCGRGTAVLESLLRGRDAAGTDSNPVAACVAGAKADPPPLPAIQARLQELQAHYRDAPAVEPPESTFFRACFERRTLSQITFFRSHLSWRTSRVDRFLAAVLLGCLHGESHKSQNCLSNRMPRTISTKPEYSLRWWAAHACIAPYRDVFSVVSRLCEFRLAQGRPCRTGTVRMRDARVASGAFPRLRGRVALLLTSPPYLDTTDYREDQWLRLWFLGGPEFPVRGIGDDRHRNPANYWQFLSEAWSGCASLLRHGTTVVIRIGGARLTRAKLNML